MNTLETIFAVVIIWAAIAWLIIAWHRSATGPRSKAEEQARFEQDCKDCDAYMLELQAKHEARMERKKKND